MTNKVQKIREEIEKRYEYWKEKEFNSYSIESEIRMSECQHLLLIIDSLQKEPEPLFKVGDIIRSKVWKSAVHKIVSMDDSAYYFENGGMVRLDNQEQWELVEEPVSEDLEEAAKNHAAERYRVTRDRELAEKCKWSFKAGAKWQEEKDNEEKVLIYKHGFEDCKKQMSEDSKKELPKVWDRETLDEYAYQVAYDLSNDWMRETATWDDVETAVKLGAKWQKEKDQKK